MASKPDISMPADILRLPAGIESARPYSREASIIMKSVPQISSIGLFLKPRLYATGNRSEVAATDSKTVMVWPAFFLCYNEKERTTILLHEFLHAAYAHPQRGALLQKRLQKAYCHKTFNIAADGMVNQAILNDRISRSSNPYCVMPADAITMSQLIVEAEAIVALSGDASVPVARMKEISKLTVETLYMILSALKKLGEETLQGMEPSGSAEGGSDDGPSNIASLPSREQQTVADNQKKARAFVDRLQQADGATDLILGEIGKMTPEELNESIRAAGDRLKAAKDIHGNTSGGLLDTLEGDIPVAKTRWQSHFRSLSQKHLSRDRTKNHCRPGRKVLSQEGMSVPDVLWEPARRRQPAPIVVIIEDSSGSVDQDEFKAYLSEIMAMKKRTNAILYNIVADAAIQTEGYVDKITDIKDIEFVGRGGTDFRPGIARAVELKADMIVYLTDLGGTFPEQDPKIPVIWAVCSKYGAGGATVPFGRIVEIS